MSSSSKIVVLIFCIEFSSLVAISRGFNLKNWNTYKWQDTVNVMVNTFSLQFHLDVKNMKTSLQLQFWKCLFKLTLIKNVQYCNCTYKFKVPSKYHLLAYLLREPKLTLISLCDHNWKRIFKYKSFSSCLADIWK